MHERVRAVCSCSCGGANHGGAFGAQSTQEETEQAVAAYRARVAKEEDKRAKAAAAARRRAEREFEAWSTAAPGRAELLAYLSEGPHDNEFVADMADQVAQLRTLTERQEAAVGRCMEYARRRAEAEQRRAQDAVAAVPVPTGKALEITGEIVHARYEEGDYGRRGQFKMLVRGDDGWRVWSTVPVALTPRISSTTVRDLHGKRVRFTADVEPSPKDASYGFAKRPRKAEALA
ncbi:hypothetical protein ACGF12_30485 [Kitasatospora sp. NPDC048296]|uniref:hypothetical protein n=1 Tax=Kitasatospora sp. NPDC048296 TaxID=3364048 RepID=UPI00371A7CD8